MAKPDTPNTCPQLLRCAEICSRVQASERPYVLRGLTIAVLGSGLAHTIADEAADIEELLAKAPKTANICAPCPRHELKNVV